MDNDCTCSMLRQLTRRITGIYDQALASDGLTVTQYSLLARIGKNGPMASLALASEVGMDRSTLSRTMKPLLDAGWVSTVDFPAELLLDKRSFGVQLTESGKKKWKSAMPAWRKAQAEIDRLLGSDAHQKLKQAVDIANDKMRSHAAA
jgi:DNA-binding MarR family transcriptional regulator